MAILAKNRRKRGQQIQASQMVHISREKSTVNNTVMTPVGKKKKLCSVHCNRPTKLLWSMGFGVGFNFWVRFLLSFHLFVFKREIELFKSCNARRKLNVVEGWWIALVLVFFSGL